MSVFLPCSPSGPITLSAKLTRRRRARFLSICVKAITVLTYMSYIRLCPSPLSPSSSRKNCYKPLSRPRDSVLSACVLFPILACLRILIIETPDRTNMLISGFHSRVYLSARIDQLESTNESASQSTSQPARFSRRIRERSRIPALYIRLQPPGSITFYCISVDLKSIAPTTFCFFHIFSAPLSLSHVCSTSFFPDRSFIRSINTLSATAS